MAETPTTKFTAAARVLAHRTAELGLVVPGFRSPPRIIGVNRTMRRARGDAGGIVAVRLSGRPFTAALGDMIEGVIVINGLDASEADKVRSLLWRAMLQFTVESGTPVRRSSTEAPAARVA